jgi:DNA-binding XRE family transcriptional regulator
MSILYIAARHHVEYIPWIISPIGANLCPMDKDFDALRRLLGANVRRLRNSKKLSQEEFAFEAEIDRTYVSQIERAIINPSLLVLHKVARVLGVSIVELLGRGKSKEK